MTDFEGNVVEPKQQRITWDPIMAEKGGFKHFMLKEIYEQPRAVRDTVQGRVSLDTGKVYLDPMDISEDDFKGFTSIKIAACGTSWHAGLAGKYMIEQLARVPVEVDYASEFRYRDPVLHRKRPADRDLAIRRDGRHDRRACARRNKPGCKVLAICNVQGSMITREADGHDPDARRAGDRRGFDQGVYGADDRALSVRALSRAGARTDLDEAQAKKLAQDLAELPLKIEQLLNDADSDRGAFERVFPSCRISYISDAASIFRSLWKAR